MSIKKTDIVQFKLVTGQEVIAQILEKDDESFIINYALDMIPIEYEDEPLESNRSYYILKPYISYSDDLERVVSINPFAVVSIHQPPASVKEQYLLSIGTISDLMSDKEEPEETESLGNVLHFPKRSIKVED